MIHLKIKVCGCMPMGAQWFVLIWVVAWGPLGYHLSLSDVGLCRVSLSGASGQGKGCWWVLPIYQGGLNGF